jgi:hypothetical protein
VTRCIILRGHLPRGAAGCRGCAARQRQRHADDSQYRHGFLLTPSLRGLLLNWHVEISSDAVAATRTTLSGTFRIGALQARRKTRRPSTTSPTRAQFHFTSAMGVRAQPHRAGSQLSLRSCARRKRRSACRPCSAASLYSGRRTRPQNGARKIKQVGSRALSRCATAC